MLRKLIHSRLNNPEDDSTDEDSASASDDDCTRNPLKSRLSSWLSKNIGSEKQPVTVRSESRTSLHASLPPHPPPPAPQAAQQVLTAPDPTTTPSAPQETPQETPQAAQTIAPAPVFQHADGEAILHAQPVFADADSSSASGSGAAEAPAVLVADCIAAPSEASSCTTSASASNNTDAASCTTRPSSLKLPPRPARPKTFLFSPSPSYLSERSSSHVRSPSEPDSRMLQLDNGSDPEVFRRSTARDWSDDIKSFIRQADLAFESVGEAIERAPSFELPDLGKSLGDSTSDKRASRISTRSNLSHVTQAEYEDDNIMAEQDQEEKEAEVEEEPPLSPRKDRKSVDRTSDIPTEAQRRMSRSLPPLPDQRASLAETSPPPGRAIRPTPPLDPHRLPPKRSNQQSVAARKRISAFSRSNKSNMTCKTARRQSRAGSRWNIPEGLADIFTGDRFKKIEVDEMLTPDRLEALKKKRDEARREALAALASDPRPSSSNSSKSGISSTKDTSLDVTRADTSIKTSFEDEDWVVPTKSKSPPQPRQSTSSPRSSSEDHHSRPSHEGGGLTSDHDSDEEEDGYSRLKTVSNPPASEGSASQEALLLPPPAGALPVIPEDQQPKPDMTLVSEEDDEFYYLKGTPYSLATPGFRHGPIAFAKSEVGKAAMTMDDTLDWTAFQMAILGGAGFDLQLGPDVSDDDDGKLIEDVVAWFGDFGFETHGSLIPEEAASPRSSSHSTTSTTSMFDHELPIPLSSEYQPPPYGFNGYNIGSTANTGGYDEFDKTRFFRGDGRGMKPYGGQGGLIHPDQHGAHSSVPPYVVGDGGHGPSMEHEKDGGVAEMGFNLENDLGDFLKWEAQHAFAGGYYG